MAKRLLPEEKRLTIEKFLESKGITDYTTLITKNDLLSEI